MDGSEAELSFEAAQLQKQLGLDQGFTPEDVGQALGVNVSTVYRWLQSGDLAARQVGKQWRITAGNVAEFIDKQESARLRLIEAKAELRLAKRLKKGQNWHIAECLICGSPVVTNGLSSPKRYYTVAYNDSGEGGAVCPWPKSCLPELNERLGIEATEAGEMEPEEIPFE